MPDGADRRDRIGRSRMRTTKIPEIDVSRTAKLLINGYRDQATIEAAQRADAIFKIGDLDGRAVW